MELDIWWKSTPAIIKNMPAIYCLYWEGGGNIVRGVKISLRYFLPGVKISYDIFTPGWEYRGVKISYHTGNIFVLKQISGLGKSNVAITKTLYAREKKASDDNNWSMSSLSTVCCCVCSISNSLQLGTNRQTFQPLTRGNIWTSEVWIGIVADWVVNWLLNLDDFLWCHEIVFNCGSCSFFFVF